MSDTAGSDGGQSNETETEETETGDSGNGDQAPAAFKLSGLNPRSAEVMLGDSITVSAYVRNTGESAGTTAAELSIGGNSIDSTLVNLEGGASTMISFKSVDTSTLGAGESEHTISADDSEISGSLTILDPTKQTKSLVSEKVDKLLSEAAWVAGEFKSAKETYEAKAKPIRNKINKGKDSPGSITKSDVMTIHNQAISLEDWIIENVFPHYRKHSGMQYIEKNRNGREAVIPKIKQFIDLNDEGKVFVNFKKLAGRIAFMSWGSESLLIPKSGVDDKRADGVPAFDKATGARIYGVHYPEGGMTYHVGDSFVNETNVARRVTKKALNHFTGEKLLIAAGSPTAQEHAILQIGYDSAEKANSEYDQFVNEVTNDGKVSSENILIPLPVDKLAWPSEGGGSNIYAYGIQVDKYVVLFGPTAYGSRTLWKNKKIGETWINKQGKI